MKKVKISEVCKITNGFAFKSAKYVEEGARVIRITNVQKGKIEDNNPKFYSLKDVERLDSYKISENDILMSLTGNVGRVGRFPKDMLPAYINQRICRVMPKNDSLDDNYLFHYFNSDFFEREAIRNSAGVAQLNLSTTWLNEHDIPLPSLTIQKSIAAQLDKADELVQYSRQLLEKYDELQQSLFLDMFGDPVVNEKGWRIRELSEFISQLEAGVSVNSDSEYSEYKILKTSSVYSGKFEPHESKFIRSDEIERAKINPKANSIIISRMNTEDLVCRCVYVDKDYKSLFLPDRLWQTVHTKLPQNILWLSYVLGNQRMMREIQKKASGTSGSMKNISKKNYLSSFIIYPPLFLQNEFASHIASIDYQKTLVKETLAKSEDMFNGLLQEHFG